MAGLVVRQRAGTVPFDDQGLKGFTAWILMLGQVVRKLDGYLHNRIVRLAYEPRKRLLATRSRLGYIIPVKKCASPSARLPLQLKSFTSEDFHVHHSPQGPFPFVCFHLCRRPPVTHSAPLRLTARKILSYRVVWCPGNKRK